MKTYFTEHLQATAPKPHSIKTFNQVMSDVI